MIETNVLAAEIRALRDMGGIALRARFATVTGRPTATRNNTWIRQHLARTLAEQIEGDTPPAVHRAIRYATTPPVAPSEPFKHHECVPPVGSIVRRRYRGRSLEVRVTRTGFEFDGSTYLSLSAIARGVTGARWSGPLFFGLVSRSRTKRGA